MSTAPDVRETLREVADTVDVPPIDEVAFGRRVRRARSGALSVRATAGAAAVALMAGAAFVGTTLVGTGPRGAAPAVGPPQGVLADERLPVYLSVGGRLAALDPLGEVHDLGVPVEEVLGATPDGVIAVDRESHLVRFRAVVKGDRWRFRRVDPPVAGSVQRAELSSATGRVAWISLDNELVVRDLDSQEDVFRTPVSESTALMAVGDRALVSEGRSLRLLGGEEVVELAWDGIPSSAGVGGDTVALSDSAEGSTSIYDVSSGEAVVLDELPGWGELSPDGSAFLATPGEEAGRPVLWTRAGEPRSVTGLAGTVTGVTWADDETAVVTTSTWAGGQQERTDVYVCEVSNAGCALALEGGQGEVSVR
jgi:hypothetical protein